MEELVKANNAIDIYEEYFSGRNLDYSTEKPEARTIAGLTDPSNSKRGAQYVCWHPDGSSRLAVAHSILEFQKLQVDLLMSLPLVYPPCYDHQQTSSIHGYGAVFVLCL